MVMSGYRARGRNFRRLDLGIWARLLSQMDCGFLIGEADVCVYACESVCVYACVCVMCVCMSYFTKWTQEAA